MSGAFRRKFMTRSRKVIDALGDAVHGRSNLPSNPPSNPAAGGADAEAETTDGEASDVGEATGLLSAAAAMGETPGWTRLIPAAVTNSASRRCCRCSAATIPIDAAGRGA